MEKIIAEYKIILKDVDNADLDLMKKRWRKAKWEKLDKLRADASKIKYKQYVKLDLETPSELETLISDIEVLMARVKGKIKFSKVFNRIRWVFVAFALIIILPTIIQSLSEGDTALVDSVRNATQSGMTNKAIFEAIDPDAKWQGGDTEDGDKVVDLTFNASQDFDQDGIMTACVVKIRWIVTEDQYIFYALSIDDAIQNDLMGPLMYQNFINMGLESN